MCVTEHKCVFECVGENVCVCVRKGANSTVCLAVVLQILEVIIIKGTSSQRGRDTYYVCERERVCVCG